ncbi:hypothetical protein QNO08_03175 [Arthrobacter sp. zg-Y820]|uniref:hypothetical protein n=1 Tax=unclassified Arthrobacter TaxID=235627 RepID=UPI001E4B8B25|nr:MULTISPECIES: hypothetical protein [unclassified Arthrobacter]MCC9195336.1 hypothetical protein [Arthrobacter sp. zg-Y820]MDK1278195.1 hypothetical protein [Arthrobacter sp. zg.Y820]WIB10079.1 hypothetical protein QNO08_03175 [Arthrobacter sp. zg-Y820]
MKIHRNVKITRITEKTIEWAEWEPQSNDVNVLALAGLILGIVALVLFWIPLVNYV